jgi:hypothetical protein
MGVIEREYSTAVAGDAVALRTIGDAISTWE